MTEPRLASDREQDLDKKALGQYFSGPRVSELLVALALESGGQLPRSVIDPFLGSGDLIDAVAAHVPGVEIAGVEIDPAAAALARTRLPSRSTVFVGDAFDCALTSTGAWDLVISNPPYVRVDGGHETSATISRYDAEVVRARLRRSIDQNAELEPAARRALLAATAYSGRADLAVPGLILSASLVRPGGTLALVMPQAWLRRQYAIGTIDLLGSLFRLRYVVIDTSGDWFDATVRAALIVATRVDIESGSLNHGRLVVSRGASDERSLVGSAFSGPQPEQQFASWASARKRGELEGVTLTEGSRSNFVSNEGVGLGGPVSTAGQRNQDWVSLADLGWVAGQGHRSGANDFFHLDWDGHRVRSRLTGEVFAPVGETLTPLLRRQSDLKSGRPVVDESFVPSAFLLTLSQSEMGESGPILRHIEAAKSTYVGKGERRTAVPELSAVRTNASRDGSRSWFHLPPLQPRHTPELFVGRISDRAATFGIRSSDPVVVDANFAGFFRRGVSLIDVWALFGFLNNASVALALEDGGSVLGAGGLKIEANLLARLHVPSPESRVWPQLAQIGQRFRHGEISLEELRLLSTEVVVGAERGAELLAELDQRVAGRRGR